MALGCAEEAELCETCELFDLRRLFLAAKADRKRFVKIGIRGELIPEALAFSSDLVHPYHANLLELKRAASACSFCAEVWRTFYSNSGLPADLDDLILSCGVSGAQLYIVVNVWGSGHDTLPKLMVFQQDHACDVTRVIASFDLCSAPGQEPSDEKLSFADILFPYSGSKQCLALAREWLHSCEKQHVSCKQRIRQSNLGKPTRLLDVSGNPYLFTALGHERYAALSYSWGGETALMLTNATKDQFAKYLPAEALPPTIADAVITTQALGLDYLWVDALCIFQDSEEDFLSETTKMGDIYRGSDITIQGSSAAKTSDHLFAHRDISHIRLPWRNAAQSAEYVYLREDSAITSQHWKRAPINTRGWCLQESLLATRSLWLGEQVMMLECCQYQWDETGRRGLATEPSRSKRLVLELSKLEQSTFKSWLLRAIRLPIVWWYSFPRLEWARYRKTRDWRWLLGLRRCAIAFPSRLTGLSSTISGYGSLLTIYDLWREIVRQYTERNLTRYEDVFPALSGMAHAFYRASGESYHAGMWQGDLIRSLNWKRQTPDWDWENHRNSFKEFRPPENEERRKHAEQYSQLGYIAPSWSWASMSLGEVKFHPAKPMQNILDADYERRNAAKVIYVRTSTTPPNKFGRVNNGLLILQAPAVTIADPRREADAGDKYPFLQQEVYRHIGRMPDLEFRLKHRGHKGQQFALLRICEDYDFRRAFEPPVIETQLMVIETCEAGSDDCGANSALLWRRVGHMNHLTGSFSNTATFQVEEKQKLNEQVQSVAWRTETIHLI